MESYPKRGEWQIYSKNGKDPCTNSDAAKNHLPFRFSVGLLGQESGDLGCPWPYETSIARIVGTALFFFTALFIFYFGLWQQKRYLSYMAILFLSIYGVYFFGMMAVDANDVRKSQSWCDGNLSGLEFVDGKSPTEVYCHYSDFVFMVLQDTAAFLLSFVTATLYSILIWRYWTLSTTDEPGKELAEWRDEEDLFEEEKTELMKAKEIQEAKKKRARQGDKTAEEEFRQSESDTNPF
eukprot:TRINITY_DN2330_c0_g1_i2.p2 TRINITY_DN2330_c0_g1~~TRINITY_DN2330_c0_g1_i2.p2  ORF type:complete len:237 (+),score=41.41 TRINITY_DN2330_c0_g1_i2:159-869(+)